MRSSSAARRLARALLEVGIEEKAYERYSAELKGAVEVFRANPELYKVLLNPMYKLDERKTLIDKVSSAIELSPAVSRFLYILVQTRKIKLLEGVLEAYLKLEDGLAGRLRATVESPAALPEALVGEIRNKLADATGKNVIVESKVNPGLIGGLVIRMDNTVMDGSLKTQLGMMKEKILQGVV